MASNPPLREIQLLIFDLDGTLVDSMDDLVMALNLTRRNYGFAPLTREKVVCHVGYGSDVLVRACVPVEPEELQRACAQYIRHYNDHLLDTSRPNPGVTETLAHFRGRHLAVVTNKKELESRRLLEGLQILDPFGMVVGGDTYPRCKPDPLQIEMVLAHYGCGPSQCIMVGDHANDIRAGKSAGTYTAGFSTDPAGREALAPEKPDLMIDRMDLLIALLD